MTPNNFRPQPERNDMYQLSTDYAELFRGLCEGHVAVGFVNYRLGLAFRPSRDVCSIRRRGPYEIDFSARGISYCSVNPWDAEAWPVEADLFIATCKAANLEYIPSNASRLEAKNPDKVEG